jgi:hypothetical protein
MYILLKQRGTVTSYTTDHSSRQKERLVTKKLTTVSTTTKIWSSERRDSSPRRTEGLTNRQSQSNSECNFLKQINVQLNSLYLGSHGN